jgi:hypothetical protein
VAAELLRGGSHNHPRHLTCYRAPNSELVWLLQVAVSSEETLQIRRQVNSHPLDTMGGLKKRGASGKLLGKDQ